MPPAQWRLLEYETFDGATNMAIDEAILEAHLQGLVPPTLRLYGFAPPAISLGHNQSCPPYLLKAAAARGLDIVRRPTGGRAVLHLNDLTYCLVGKTRATIGTPGRPATATTAGEGFLSKSVSAAYKEICKGLQLAFEQMDVQLELGSADISYKHLHDCFLATTGSDLHHRGKKMIGSAQLRRHGGVLQHGSILLDQDQSLMAELLSGSRSLNIRHANLFESVGRTISIADLQESLRHGFEEAFDVSIKTGALSEQERRTAAVVRDKYRWK